MIRSLTDPERFRVLYRGGRRYVDREPADGTWEPTGEKDKLINCTTVAKAISSDAFFKKVGSSRVPLDALRVAKYADENLERLAGMESDERIEAMATAATRDLNRAAERGTAVHSLIEALLKGQPPLILDGEAEQYLDIAEKVATDFADQLTHMEVVAFHRDHPERGLDYAGTFDGFGKSVFLDWKTRGPDAKHGAYEKEVAQLGLGTLCSYYFDVDRDGNLVRTAMPSFDELLVVSIRPDSYEVYPIDPVLAADVAEKAIEVYTAKSTAASRARAATGQPRPMAGETAPRTQPARIEPVNAPAPPEPKTAPEGGPADADKVVALLERARSHAAVAATVNRWVRDAARAHVDWRIGIEAQYSTERRYALSYVAVELAEHLCSGGDDAAAEDEVARAALAMVIGDDAHQPILAVGGLIGTLTIDQARRLVRIANSARLTFSDDGSPRLIVAA
ncbi:MAG TPA: hypothetical protein PLR40_16555 [Microthrixaceae bacterium]|nr:hypothetical protein [Myxococcota bacterium]HMY88969.1 hypothetical protein [Microthrixaceae bacterium]HNE38194.1 hypothetical protein [Microthrixaceae bacterium]